MTPQQLAQLQAILTSLNAVQAQLQAFVAAMGNNGKVFKLIPSVAVVTLAHPGDKATVTVTAYDANDNVVP